MRGETSPEPVYEGDYGIIATLLDGKEANYTVKLPNNGEARDGILSSYPKEHSAGYHGQALIDLAFRMREKIENFEDIQAIDIYTKRYTHVVMGSGSGDPQKYSPQASRETLDHSAMFMFAVVLQDGNWHHEESYAHKRRNRSDTIALWQKIKTHEDEAFNNRYYNEPDPLKKYLGARAVIMLKTGELIVDELSHANAHPSGATPFARADYVDKLRTLNEGICSEPEISRFIEMVEKLDTLDATEMTDLTLVADAMELKSATRDTQGIF